MGCWGITALESDNGLDAVRCVRYNLPADGQLDLGEMLERLKKDRWNAPCDVKLGCAHTSPMALAEIVVKYAREIGVSQPAVHKRKVRILKSLKKLLEN